MLRQRLVRDSSLTVIFLEFLHHFKGLLGHPDSKFRGEPVDPPWKIPPKWD